MVLYGAITLSRIPTIIFFCEYESSLDCSHILKADIPTSRIKFVVVESDDSLTDDKRVVGVLLDDDTIYTVEHEENDLDIEQLILDYIEDGDDF